MKAKSTNISLEFQPSPRADSKVIKSIKSLKLALFCVLALTMVDNAGAWQMKQAPLMTRWAALVDTNNPLPEYPRPQLVRTNWLNLNGLWQFQAGATNDRVPTGQTLSSEILVPYPMESAICGVMQYHEFSWYRRMFTVPTAWSGKPIILHLDAVNWQAAVYVNGQKVGVHQGGYDSFSYNITSYLNGGTNELIVSVYSPLDNGSQPRGKQSLHPDGFLYTSSSGIWLPVWLEPVDASGISNLRIMPDVDNSQLRLTVNTCATNGVVVVATVLSNGAAINTGTGSPQTELDIPVPHPNLWSPNNPFLYDLQVSVTHNGLTNDNVTSYFGMRKISVEKVSGIMCPQIYLNNQPIFQMGTLDQGYWPDGIYTAPTDDALKYDLQMAKALGFNMIRKHHKVESLRWFYWADKLGLLVWQDMPSGNTFAPRGARLPAINPLEFIGELTAMVTNHWNNPCLVQWDIFDEGQSEAGDPSGVGQTNTAYLVQLVKALDPSRLVDEAGGGIYYGVGDVYDEHPCPPDDVISTTKAPVIGEYGAIGFSVAGHLWNPARAGGGCVRVDTTNGIASQYDSWNDDIVYYKTSHGLNAALYTQITDVENECNGFMTYDRAVLKPDRDKISRSNLKVITGHVMVTPVLPPSQTVPQTWKYTTQTPATNWYASTFNDSSWSSGQAGFGTRGRAGVSTPWNTSDIWLRQTFTLGSLTAQDRTNLFFNVGHDQICQIYINDEPAASASSSFSTYVRLRVNVAGQNALIANGANVIAVHCHNTVPGQDVDLGINSQHLVFGTSTLTHK